jgi:hypothetical protein
MRRALRVLTATAAGPATTKPAPAGIPAPFDADVIGYFSDQNDCDWAGRTGSPQHRWAGADCNQPPATTGPAGMPGGHHPG